MTEENPKVPETPRERLLALHQELSKKSVAIMRKKNASYGSDADPLMNFRRHGLYGMVVRLDDKISRLDNFVKSGINHIDDESIEDTLVDIQNYAVLFAFWLREQRNVPSSQV